MVRALELLISDCLDSVGALQGRAGEALDFLVDGCDHDCETNQYTITVEPFELHMLRLAANEEQAPLIAAWRSSGLSVAEAIARLQNHS
jgi:hypothetical protein